MSLKKKLAFVAFSIVFCTSCKNSLNIQAPYKDITVVYGLIDQNDGVHYIRINKAFEGAGNAYSMANQYDSIYYPVSAINAVLQDSNPTTATVVNIPLDTTTTVPLEPGIFSNPKQLLYRTNATLNPNDYYNIVITNTKTSKKLRGSTTLLPDISFLQPSNLATRNITLILASQPNSTQIEWSSSPNASIYQMSLLFYYDNQAGSGLRIGQPPLQLVLQQQTAPTLTGGAQMSYYVTCQELFSLITSSLQPENGITRYPDSLGVVFTSGTDDLNTYIQLSQPRTGINQDVPSFSDVTNGIGLYTARHVQSFSKKLDNGIIDSLAKEARFTALGFVPQ